MKYICQNCGDTVTMAEDTEPWDCIFCGGRVVSEDTSDVTPNSELREIIEQWWKQRLPREGSYHRAADELEDLINE